MTFTSAWSLFNVGLLAASVAFPPIQRDDRVRYQQAGSQAQAAATNPPPGTAELPDNTTATYGDWTLRCGMSANAQAPRRTCEVVQSIVLQGQNAPLSQLAVGRLMPKDPLYFTAVLPTNVTFPSTVRIALDEKDREPVELVWTRCLPNGCFASLAVGEPMLKRWRDHDSGGHLTFKNGPGQDTIVPISFRGLGRALDALAREQP